MSVLLPPSESHKISRLAADMGVHDRPIKPWARRPAEVLARLGCKKLASDVEGGNSGRANAAPVIFRRLPFHPRLAFAGRASGGSMLRE